MALGIEGAGRESFDFVVCTSPLTQFQKMTRSLPVPPAVADLKLDYQGVVSAIFLTEKPLTPYYWMPWVDSGATAQGVIEMSNLVPLERTHGLHVNYLVNYTHRDSELFRMPDDELLRRYRTDLDALFPGVSAGVKETHVFRAPFVEPIWTTGYAKKVPPTSVIPGRLYLACTAQVYPLVNSWNSCCGVVRGMMPRLFEETAARAAAGARP
jgi:protoporphyrinogen oxidase